jgi:hypothetical protein
MRASTLLWNTENRWTPSSNEVPENPTLILYFGATDVLSESTEPLQQLVDRFPSAQICGCSSAGEICDESVYDNTIIALVLEFETTTVRIAQALIEDSSDSYFVGRALARELSGESFKHVFLLSDGLNINGTPLAAGFNEHLPDGVQLTGGLAGDGARFQKTLTGIGADLQSKRLVAIGFYGEDLEVAIGSCGGWGAFGPKRLVTASTNNVLYELDGQPALQLYKRYLGDLADELPSSGLLFPLQVLRGDGTPNLVRTLLAVNETDQSMTFAGDIPLNSRVSLMKASFDAIVDGAEVAADQARSNSVAKEHKASLLVSCVGRKLLLGQRIDEEVEAVTNILGSETVISGFYSYGELAPRSGFTACNLHNQTMTLTTIWETN